MVEDLPRSTTLRSASLDRMLVAQLPDQINLLDAMMQATERADPRYRPTNYWAVYRDMYLPGLRRRGLRDFRRDRYGIMDAFGAADLKIAPVVRVYLPRGGGLLGQLMTRAFARMPNIELALHGIQHDNVVRYFHGLTKRKFETIGLRLAEYGINRIGNPEDVVEIEDVLWSFSQLVMCSLFADAMARMDLGEDPVICELGTGMGRHAEMFAAARPRATILLFDIPPQLYVMNQYLKAARPDRVVPYERAVEVSPGAELPVEWRGKIVVLPAWRMPDWRGLKANLFWNCASFQEMEPNVVENYLGIVTDWRPECIYISAAPNGQWRGARRPGEGGVREPVTEALYRKTLEGAGYRLAERYPTDYYLKPDRAVSFVFRV